MWDSLWHMRRVALEVTQAALWLGGFRRKSGEGAPRLFSCDVSVYMKTALFSTARHSKIEGMRCFILEKIAKNIGAFQTAGIEQNSNTIL